MAEATGWAVVTLSGNIFVKTISDTRRAAIVNWLVTEHRHLVMNSDTDEDIESMWCHYGRHVDCRRVRITDDVGGARD
jgi:hypothetical protein